MRPPLGPRSSIRGRPPRLAPLSLEILAVSAPHVDPVAWRAHVLALVERYPAHTIPLRIRELTGNGYLTRRGDARAGWLTPKGAAALARSASGGAARMTHTVLLLALLVLAAIPASAQTTLITPTSRFAWAASTSHEAVTPIGTAVLTQYELDLFPRSAADLTCPGGLTGTPVVINLGKPPIVGGDVQSDLIASMPAVVTDQKYCAYLRAVGPGGTSIRTAGAGPFLRPGPIPVPAVPGDPRITP